jgi:hypothetical protein
MDITQYKEMVASMEAQLATLYEERARLGNLEDMRMMARNLEEQLVSMYQERQSSPGNPEELLQMVANLEECVVALTDDKMELEHRLEEIRHRLDTMKKKGKALGAAIFEATLFAESHDEEQAA